MRRRHNHWEPDHNFMLQLLAHYGVHGRVLYSICGAVIVFFLFQLAILYRESMVFDDDKMTVQAEIYAKQRRSDELNQRIWDKERQLHRLGIKVTEMENKLRDRLALAKDRTDLPSIYFVTPTAYRAEQKADLTRLANTLRQVPNLFWIVVDDADEISQGVIDVVRRSEVAHVLLSTRTPAQLKLNATDKNWKVPRGVTQRNAALRWLRTNLDGSKGGVVYFGDDDNTYDLRLFDEMRTVDKVGMWPVGIVGGLLVEAPIVSATTGKIVAFNAIWKPDRPYPVDMAAFAINLRLILAHKDANFTYKVPRGYQESHLLTELGMHLEDLEPKADNCTKVFVWHTRTEKTKLKYDQPQKFAARTGLSALETEAVGAL